MGGAVPSGSAEEGPPVAQPGDVQASNDFIIPDHGMTFASGAPGVEYDFFAYSPLKPEDGPFLWVIYGVHGEADRWEKVFLDFIPSAVYAHAHENNKVLVGGTEDDGTVVLVEFEFQLKGEFKVLKRAEPFADVSALGSICDIWLSGLDAQSGDEKTIFLLDGQFGLWGTVERGGSFQEISTPEQRMGLIGKRHFREIYQDAPGVQFGFSPQMPNACMDEAEEAWFRLVSFDQEKSFQVLSLEEARKLSWDRVFEEPRWGMLSAGEKYEVTYEFWKEKPFAEHGRLLEVTLNDAFDSLLSIPLDFMPTALGWIGPNLNKVLVGGKSEDGRTVLFEIEIKHENGLAEIVSQEEFGDVSVLGGICDLGVLDIEGEPQLFVLDGRRGKWGTIASGGRFEEISTPQQSKRIMGLRSFSRTYPQVDGMVISFSPLSPSDHMNPYPEDVVSLRSMDQRKTFSAWKYAGQAAADR